MPFTFVFPTILEPGVVSLPAREIYDVLVPRPRSYAPRSPRSRSLRFSKRKRKPRRSTGYEYYTTTKKKIGLEHVSNIISQKTSNSFSDYQPKGYLKRHNLIHVFFLCRHFQNLSFTNNVLEFYNFYHVNKYLAK